MLEYHPNAAERAVAEVEEDSWSKPLGLDFLGNAVVVEDMTTCDLHTRGVYKAFSETDIAIVITGLSF